MIDNQDQVSALAEVFNKLQLLTLNNDDARDQLKSLWRTYQVSWMQYVFEGGIDILKDIRLDIRHPWLNTANGASTVRQTIIDLLEGGTFASVASDRLWSPREFLPQLWMEPRQGEFTMQASDYLISNVEDRSDQLNHMGAAGGSSGLPSIDWAASSFARRTLDFRGAATDDCLLTQDSVNLSQAYLCWALVDADSDGANMNIFRCVTVSHGLSRLSGGNFRLLFGTNSADAVSIASSGTGIFAVLVWVDPVAKTASMWLNDFTAAATTVDRSASGTVTAPNEAIYIGARTNTGTNPWDGRIASFGIAQMSSAPTQAQRDAIGKYLIDQFSVGGTITINSSTISGFDGVKQPPTQVVLWGIGQSNRLHNADPNHTDMPVIEGDLANRYDTEYPVTFLADLDGVIQSPIAWRAESRSTPANRTFGRELVWAYRGANMGPDVELFIVKCAKGSTDLENDWDPNTTESTTTGQPGYMYHRAVDQLQVITANIRSGAIFVVGWTQGEADANVESEANNYETNQNALFDAIVTLAASEGLNAPFFLDNQLHEKWSLLRPYHATVVAAKKAVAEARNDVIVIPQDAASIALQDGDEIHVTAEGHAIMGERECDEANFILEDPTERPLIGYDYTNDILSVYLPKDGSTKKVQQVQKIVFTERLSSDENRTDNTFYGRTFFGQSDPTLSYYGDASYGYTGGLPVTASVDYPLAAGFLVPEDGVIARCEFAVMAPSYATMLGATDVELNLLIITPDYGGTGATTQTVLSSASSVVTPNSDGYHVSGTLALNNTMVLRDQILVPVMSVSDVSDAGNVNATFTVTIKVNV